VKEKIEDLEGALRRILECLRSPSYDAIANNCEHFAYFAARG
jgi:hypothetical protein